jgi:membrane protein DedA with SNARE-associated domain
VEQVNEYLDAVFSFGPIWVYAAIWAACLIENIIPPFPGDTFVIAAGALVALDRLDLVWTVLIVNSGGMLSVLFLYALGRRYGHDFFVKRNFRYLTADDVQRMEAGLTRYGALILLGSRFVIGLRSALALAAGIGKYPAWSTALFSLISYLAFTGLLLYIGMALGRNIDRIEQIVSTYNMIVIPVVTVLVVGLIARQIYVHRKRAKA